MDLPQYATGMASVHPTEFRFSTGGVEGARYSVPSIPVEECRNAEELVSQSTLSENQSLATFAGLGCVRGTTAQGIPGSIEINRAADLPTFLNPEKHSAEAFGHVKSFPCQWHCHARRRGGGDGGSEKVAEGSSGFVTEQDDWLPSLRMRRSCCRFVRKTCSRRRCGGSRKGF